MGAVLEGQANVEEWQALDAFPGLRELLAALVFNAGRLWGPDDAGRRLMGQEHVLADHLISAVQGEDSSRVKLLINAGADVNVCDKNGDTALITAIKKNNEKCIYLLIEAGADVNKCSTDGNSPLLVAASRYDTPLIELLIKLGADVNYENKMFPDFNCAMVRVVGSFLHNHSITKRLETVRLFLKGGAFVNIGSVPQFTAELQIKRDFLRTMALHRVMLAAGDITNLYVQKLYDPKVKERESDMSLKHFCREKIRNHLIHKSPINLLFKVPKLGLPPVISEYLVHNEFAFHGGKFV